MRYILITNHHLHQILSFPFLKPAQVVGSWAPLHPAATESRTPATALDAQRPATAHGD